MRSAFAAFAIAAAALAWTSPADAKGCLKGALVGGVAGHYVGHHGMLGAAAGCLLWPSTRQQTGTAAADAR